MPVLEFAYEIPVLAPDLYAGNYTAMPVDMADPRRNEELVRLDSVGVAYDSYHARKDGTNWPYCRPLAGALPDVWLRASVAAMLARVNDRLKPFGAALVVLDGYRTLECQRALWDFFYTQAVHAAPAGTPAMWRRMAARHAADPRDFKADDPATWPAHSTGAAADIFLRDCDSGAYYDLGGRFEDVHDSAVTDHFERQLAAGNITASDPRLRNRRLLHWAMRAENFENDPAVFWHYDWGDQLYVQLTRALRPHPAKAAWYGYISPP